MQCPRCHYEIEVRTPEQNSKLWPMLTDISKQVTFCVDGVQMRLSPQDCKDVMSCMLRRHQRCVEGLDCGPIFLGDRTSCMNKEHFSLLIEFMYKFGADHDVQWSEPALQAYEKYREAA